MIKLKELRKTKHGLSQEKLAKVLGVSRKAVSTWETGRHQPDNDMLIKIAKFFNVPVDVLINDNIQTIDTLSPYEVKLVQLSRLLRENAANEVIKYMEYLLHQQNNE